MLRTTTHATRVELVTLVQLAGTLVCVTTHAQLLNSPRARPFAMLDQRVLPVAHKGLQTARCVDEVKPVGAHTSMRLDAHRPNGQQDSVTMLLSTHDCGAHIERARIRPGAHLDACRPDGQQDSVRC